MLVSELDTPAVVVDLEVMERNVARIAQYCRDHRLKLRPHTKSHKIPSFAARQLAAGASGITVAKIGEAEVMLESGATDVLIAYPLVGREKAHRLGELAERAKITVSLDSREAAQSISDEVSKANAQIDVLVELDAGFRRCGVANEDQALQLAQQISDLPGLHFEGLLFFPGHFQVGPAEREVLLESCNRLLDRMLGRFERAGVPVSTVSGGSTPTALDGHRFHGVNEIRPGMYIFNDRNIVGIGVATLADCALSIAATVVSTSVHGRAIIDAGSKTFSSDRYLAGDGRGFAIVVEDPDAELESMSEEHGHLNISRSSRAYRVGDRLTLIPNHCCSTVNMHDQIYGMRDGEVEEVLRVAGRGKVR
jgi:D-serine deaminase-like pyridoxal phosphate-dependent protein